MKTTIQSKGQKFTVEIYSLDKDPYLKKQDKVDYHSWRKGQDKPVDSKQSIYINGVFACFIDCKITISEAKKLIPVQETIEQESLAG